MDENEIETGNEAFYSGLFSSNDVGLACQAMNAAISQGDSPFASMRAEDCFRLVVRGHFETSLHARPTL